MTWPEPPQYYEPPVAGHKVILQQPQFPVIYPDPTFSEVLGNMRAGHWATVAGMTLAGASLGYWKGAQSYWQRPGMIFMAAILGKTGFVWASTNCAYRLMGYKENSAEVARNMPGLLAREQY